MTSFNSQQNNEQRIFHHNFTLPFALHATSLHVSKIPNKFTFESYNCSEDKHLPTPIHTRAAYTVLVLKSISLLQNVQCINFHVLKRNRLDTFSGHFICFGPFTVTEN